jgi:hypothetical protein
MSIAPTKRLLVPLALVGLGIGCDEGEPSDPAPPSGPQVWLDASAGVGQATDATRAFWIDRSEFGNDAFVVQQPPGLSPDGSLQFDGVDDLLGLADADGVNMGGPWSERTVAVAFTT